jgi:Pyrimidine deaminase
MNYEELMLRAITKAEKYKYTAKPNPVVGAIIVNGNEIISEGYHEKYGENHAEVNAIEQAYKYQGKKFQSFSELALICTLEPCSHSGKNRILCTIYCKNRIKQG